MDQRFWGVLAGKFLHDVALSASLCVGKAMSVMKKVLVRSQCVHLRCSAKGRVHESYNRRLHRVALRG